ncbi:hypothetical protein P3T35_006109 [Kitasatospora sp. GP30]|uniref:helix-turn-helix domain-containing protein n=1 Tax=Kitasatospora sp. GP30 TaxID=3035084 RepID=UPI0024731356|nr:helix-turn-helix domain-containing protein [Kitasatospora sp. GP30]MDH6144073.1 hypothetical protein [Kitasatospora sp. GP30]
MRLAGLDAPLPPILVERASMRVVDGAHRLMAALLKGRQTIEVEFFDGSPEDAFLRAVEANVSHGLPLSLADRRAAVSRIVATHPRLSDRAIARIAGVGAKLVAAIRRRSTAALPQLEARVGQDGRVRPVNGVAGRLRAAELLAERPEASLREVAQLAGISPATVSDVRKRLRDGKGPLTDWAAIQQLGEAGDDGAPASVEAPVSAAPESRNRRRLRLVSADPTELLEKLVRDPSLRHKEEGRQLLRLLRQNAMGIRDWADLTAAVPPHCRALVVSLARQYAATWQDFAQELDDRVRSLSRNEPASTVGTQSG